MPWGVDIPLLLAVESQNAASVAVLLIGVHCWIWTGNRPLPLKEGVGPDLVRLSNSIFQDLMGLCQRTLLCVLHG